MESSHRLLSDLFAQDAEAFSALTVSEETQARLRTDLGALDRTMVEAFSIGEVLRTLYQALDEPLSDILQSAWSSMIELQEYRDSRKHPPGETSKVRFGKHKVTSRHHPKLEILLNGKGLGAITFDVLLTLHVTGTTLQVRDGRIWRASGSELEGEGLLSYSGLQLAKKKIDLFSIPGDIEFEDGLPIPSLFESTG